MKKISLSLLVTFLSAASGIVQSPSEAEGKPPQIEKFGTIECDLVEASPVVWNGRLHRFEYVRENYRHNQSGDSYFRFVDAESGEKTPGFARGFHLGSAYVDNGSMYVYGVEKWGAQDIVVFRSEDLVSWASQTAVATPGWGVYNCSVCKAGDRFVMAFEVGEPKEVVGIRFTMRFAESADLLDWDILSEDRVYTQEKYSACPDLHHLEGYYYMIYLEAYPGPAYMPHIVRSTDLIHWESSPRNPMMRFSDEDKQFANPYLTEEERDRIRAAKNINNSDVEVCEFEGKTVIYYSWGNQRGIEFLAAAESNAPLDKFLRGFFP